MRKYPENPNNTEYTEEKCIEITRQHRKFVMDIMRIFSYKLRKL
jgi:hypothetical protein